MTATATKTNTEKALVLERVEEARQSLKAAQDRLRSLSHEVASLPDRMREALSTAAKQRADLARQGESAAFAQADLDVEELRQRKGQAALELWAVQIAVEEAKLALYDAEDARDRLKKAEAEEAFAEIKPRYEKLRQEYDAARGAAQLDGFNTHRMNQKKDAKARLSELENSYPDA